jgi:hypothetical protein
VQFEIPRLRTLARHALPHVLEGTIAPVVIFLCALRLMGPTGAMVAGLAWGYGALTVRVFTKRRIPGLLVLGTLTLTARTMIAVLTGSVFVYFLQPTLGTALVAAAFLLSVPLRRPLAERLARDFCPIPSEVLADHRVRRIFLQLSLLWAATQLANAVVTFWLLVSQSVGTFVVARMITSSTLTVTAIALSVLWFRRTMTRHGILVVRRAALDHQGA